MKRAMLAMTIWAALATTAHAQRLRAPVAQEEALDTLQVMSARDSAIYRNRITAARNPFKDCKGQAFQTCASGETEARLSSDGTAYGVLMTRSSDGKAAYLWRITGRAGGGAGGAGGGGGRRARGAKRRG